MKRRIHGVAIGVLPLACLLGGSGAIQAQGLDLFSAPPPERVEPRTAPKPAEKATPRHHRPPTSKNPRYETLRWFSRTLICSGTSQVCEEAAIWPLTTDFQDTYSLRLQIPTRYCSPLALDVELDGTLLGSSGLLNPGETRVLRLGTLSKGTHVLRLSALGAPGGCNRGVLERWGIDLSLTNEPAARSRARALEPTTNARRVRESSRNAARTTQPAPQTSAAPPRKRASGTLQVINVSGAALTGLNAYSLASSLALARERGARAVVVNLERVTYMTEPGAEALLQGEARFGRGNLVLVGLRGEPLRVLERVAPGHFRIYPSKAAAISALRGR